MSTITYHYLLANKKLIESKNRISEILLTAQETVLGKLPTYELDLIVSHQPSKVIPELGIMGSYSREARTIEIILDIDHENLRANFVSELTSTFAHEYMHVAREEHVQWENGTFLDAMIAEGLSQSFELETQPKQKPSMYAINLSDEEIRDAWQKAQPILDHIEYDFSSWFFGNEEIKRWTGYSLGYWLVQKKIAATGLQASELVQLNSSEFV